MKTLKLLSMLIFAVFLISTVTAFGDVYGEWEDESQTISITKGDSVDFNFDFFSMDAPMTVNIKLYDSNSDLVYTFKDNSVISTPCTQNGNPISGTACYAGINTIDSSVYENHGFYEVIMTYSDVDGYSTSHSLSLTIQSAINHAPILSYIGDKSTNENQKLQFYVSATDADEDALTYSASGLPSGASFNPSTRKFLWTPTYKQSGIYYVTFTVDDETDTDSEKIKITVDNVNRNPTITSSPITQVNEGESYNYNVDATDADGDTLTYSLPKKPSWLSINSNTGVITGTAPKVYQDTDYDITIKVKDGKGGSDTQSYTLTVKNVVGQDCLPTITIIGASVINIYVGTTYNDQGATAWDMEDGNLTDYIITTGLPIDTNSPGIYQITYTVEDSFGHIVTAIRAVKVIKIPDTTPPIIIITSPEDGQTYDSHVTELTYTVTDEHLDSCWYSVDGGETTVDIVCNEIITGLQSVEGSNTWTVYAKDSYNNEASASVTFIVEIEEEDTTPPIITLLGNNLVNVTIGTSYTDAGATAWDDVDDNITANIVVVNPVDTNTIGTYTITYNVQDSAGNNAEEVTRTVNVYDPNDTTTPIITVITPEQGREYKESEITFEIKVNEYANIVFSLDENQNITMNYQGIDNRILTFIYTLSIADGKHTVIFYATDINRNIGSASIDFSIDTKAKKKKYHSYQESFEEDEYLNQFQSNKIIYLEEDKAPEKILNCWQRFIEWLKRIFGFR